MSSPTTWCFVLVLAALAAADAALGAESPRFPWRPARWGVEREALVVSIAAQAPGAPAIRVPMRPAPVASELALKRSTLADGQKSLSIGRRLRDHDVGATFDVAAGTRTVVVALGSHGALHLRSAWRFHDAATYEVLTFGRNGEALATRTGQQLGDDASVVWSAVTSGHEQTATITRVADDGRPWTFELETLAHFHTGIDGRAPRAEKGLGDSEPCQSDVACLFGAIGPVDREELTSASTAVARMVMTSADGSSGLCSGTLLNSNSWPTPYFISAYHCSPGIVAIDFFWFYERAQCGFGAVSPSVQTTGGAQGMWAAPSLDGWLLRLNQPPPAGVHFAGWWAGPIAPGSTVLAIHHPRGDVKKASFGTVVGVNTQPVSFSDLGAFPPGTFFQNNWQQGVVEPGSSGSGIFTNTPTDRTLYLRGTLTGGNASCSNPASTTFYGRLDLFYSGIAPFLLGGGDETVAAVEYFHPGFGHYFVTAQQDEIDGLDRGALPGWRRTGETWQVWTGGGKADVCRFFTTAFAPKSSHFYTASAAECNRVKANPVWQYEKLAFQVALPTNGACASGTRLLYRLYNGGRTGAPNHRYTTSAAIRSQMIAQGFVPEDDNNVCVPQ